MFEYTCPKCQRTSPAKAIPDGGLMPCAACGQSLCVVPDNAAPPAPSGRAMPLLAASSGLCGLVVAAGILLVWLFRGPRPGRGRQIGRRLWRPVRREAG